MAATGKLKGFRAHNLKEVVVRPARPAGPDGPVMPRGPACDGDAEKAEQIIEVFRKFDVNGDGVITQDELARLLRALNLDPASLADGFDAMDRNGDGKLQYEEFVDWVTGRSTDWEILEPKSVDPETYEDHEDHAESDDDLEKLELTLADLEKRHGPLPVTFTMNGLTVFNNMTARFPGFDEKQLLLVMAEENYHGGHVLHRLRDEGITEVKVDPPKPVRVGRKMRGVVFPAEYRVALDAQPLRIYEEEVENWSVQCCLEEGRKSAGLLMPGKKFMVLEVRRGASHGFCFGRVESRGERPCWVCLGLELKSASLHYSSAERL
eukprot:TRINITY_DN101811_c0_g1_i1.p1 TRINITY_DN101811_c0_g1~~TRINITY_DN101811_c0_g1_i1.p1  ORF type:complete len:322 (+),score=48.85 TRINITY_DN101811_c0_g1_i1:200-1165(+)